jgi:hypothetical protein
VLAGQVLREEGLERIVANADRFVPWHLPIRLDAMLN